MTTYDFLREAIDRLIDVHESMLDAVSSSQEGPEDKWIRSSDFDELNALYSKLEELSKKFTPDSHRPTWAELIKILDNKEETQ